MSGQPIDLFTDGPGDVAGFLAAMWGHGPHSVSCWVPGRGFVPDFADEPAQLTSHLAELQKFDTWVGAHPLRAVLEWGRGTRDDVAEVVALPADLDWAHETRRTDDLLPSEPEVRDRLRRLGPDLQPSVVVHSGHGLQPWWLLSEPVSPDEAEQLIAQLDAALAQVELVNGRPDLASILRLPGTQNHKGDAAPVPVVIESMDLGRRFVPQYLRKHLPAARVGGAPGGGTKHRRGAVTEGQQALCDFVVSRHGGHSVDVWRDGSVHIVRPGKLAKDGSSASVIVGTEGDALLTVFSPHWPEIGPGPGEARRCWVLGTDGELHHPHDPLAGFSITANGPAPAAAPGPPQLDPAALHGILGEVVAMFRPHTEACDAALLVTAAVQVGNYIGRGPHVVVESDRHGCALNAALVGESARARKGTAAGRVQALMNLVDGIGLWSKDCITSGFGSGEGVITTLENESRSDPRLLVDEREFAMVLTVASREGSVLSSVLRNGWDGQPLRSRTKGSKLVATDYHLSALGHITRVELERLLTSTEQSNGFANRFLWAHVERARRLPHGGALGPNALAQVGKRLEAAVRTARETGLVTMTDVAKKRWEEIYDAIAEAELPGIVAALTNRAEAQVLRLALIYTVLDGSHQIDVVHLEAGWALWRYCEASVLYIWGDATGDRDVDRLVAAVRQAGVEGLSVTDANNTVFKGHKPVGPIAARAVRYGLVRREQQVTNGRTREVLFAA